MRFGLCAGDPDVLRQLKGWGYDYAEIGGSTVVPFEDDQRWAARREELRYVGVPLEALAGFIPASVPVIGPNVNLAQVRGYVETTVARAAEVGVSVINWGSVGSRRVPDGWPMSRAWEQIEQSAALIADIAGRHGVTIALESVNPREANVLFYLTEAANVVATVNRPNLRLNVDYYHLYLQNEPDAHLSAVGQLLAHAHTSDDHRGFPALGGWDQRPFLRSLVTIGYDGRLSFEVNRTADPDFGENARRSVARMRELWEVTSRERR